MKRRWGRRGGAVVFALFSAPWSGVPSAVSAPDAQPVGVRLVKIADLDQPLALAVRPGDDHLYVAERGGRVRRVSPDGTVSPGAVLDLSGEVSRLSSFGEDAGGEVYVMSQAGGLYRLESLPS